MKKRRASGAPTPGPERGCQMLIRLASQKPIQPSSQKSIRLASQHLPKVKRVTCDVPNASYPLKQSGVVTWTS